jgi:Zn-dependent protease with chaperone function
LQVTASIVIRLFLALPLFFLCGYQAFGQQISESLEIPPKFKVDLETAAKLRPALQAASVPASGRYASGARVLDRLAAQLPVETARKFSWQLRIVESDGLNAYSSPDGSVYVERGLARLAGSSSGLWAAILSHEIAHVTRRDWARRYLYQRSLENSSAADVVLGDPGQPTGAWSDSAGASAKLGGFCRRLELDADREGLMLMAAAGYHPDFMPALHHLLHAQEKHAKAASLFAMHPCWQERDRELSKAYVAASIEFERRWSEWYASPGGNPPVLVFADEPSVKKIASDRWEVKLPMHCQNLAGAVEVVIEGNNAPSSQSKKILPSDENTTQITGCTSPRTTVTFLLSTASADRRSSQFTPDLYVLDASGSILARADLPALH